MRYKIVLMYETGHEAKEMSNGVNKSHGTSVIETSHSENETCRRENEMDYWAKTAMACLQVVLVNGSMQQLNSNVWTCCNNLQAYLNMLRELARFSLQSLNLAVALGVLARFSLHLVNLVVAIVAVHRYSTHLQVHKQL